MTGLDARKERLLEVACIITDKDLVPVDAGVTYVIQTPRGVLSGMDEWCTTTHKATGLTDACLAPDAPSHTAVRTAILAYVLDRVPDVRAACLAGSTVHADKTFLVNEMPELVEHLHYRIVDVSTIKELVRRWYGPEKVWQSHEAVRHRYVVVLTQRTRRYPWLDCRYVIYLIAELQFYRSTVFVPGGYA